MIFIFGSPRSGSTWLAKIFDSHPDILYLHEPDIPDRGSDLMPHWFERAPTLADIERARIYLKRLVSARHARTLGIRPFFRKSYRGAVADAARLAVIYGTKLLERAGMVQLAGTLEIPDFANPGSKSRIVIKSVGALGRAEVLLAAEQAIFPIMLIRHPCAYVASMLRGQRVGDMPRTAGLGRLAITRSAVRLGLTAAELRNADEVTLLAWAWLLSNAEAAPAILRANGPILIYDEMAKDPANLLKPIFARLALGWPSQTATFLARSQETEGDYYSVFRDASKDAERWRSELDQATVERIRSIVVKDPIGAQFFCGG